MWSEVAVMATDDKNGNRRMRLSILVCTLVSRKQLLEELLIRLSSQLEARDNVEIVIKEDNGEMTIGDKRNLLLDEARGKYVAFVDDDDLVAPDYVDKVIKATLNEPDCCGIEGMVTFDGGVSKKFVHSIQYKNWYEHGGVYYRCPNHLSPVKTELARQVRFPGRSMGEDQDYSMRLLPLLKTEEYIEGILYYYRYRSAK